MKIDTFLDFLKSSKQSWQAFQFKIDDLVFQHLIEEQLEGF